MSMHMQMRVCMCVCVRVEARNQCEASSFISFLPYFLRHEARSLNLELTSSVRLGPVSRGDPPVFPGLKHMRFVLGGGGFLLLFFLQRCWGFTWGPCACVTSWVISPPATHPLGGLDTALFWPWWS